MDEKRKIILWLKIPSICGGPFLWDVCETQAKQQEGAERAAPVYQL